MASATTTNKPKKPTITSVTSGITNTKKPTGLTITRKDNDITFKWKIADKNYGAGQQLKWHVNGDAFKSVSVTKTATAKTVSVTLSNYKPTTSKAMTQIEFAVRGRRSPYTENGKTVTPAWSDWVAKAMVLDFPNKPTASASLSDTYANVTTFSWNTKTSSTDKKFFRDVQLQTCLIKDSGRDGSAYEGKFQNAGTGTASDSVVCTEDTTILAQGSYSRWYRFRARGSRGPSEWTYIRHLYAAPWKAKILETSLKELDSNGYQVYVKWEALSNDARAIDSTMVQYAIATPDPGLECPAGVSWNDAAVLKDTTGTDAARFSVDEVIGYDECMFVRVNTQHDTQITYGEPALVSGAVGALQAPSDLAVVPDDTTFRATVSAVNNSDVSDSFLAVIYRTAADPQNDLIVGYIPSGASSVTVQCPDWTDAGNVAFGVRAIVGEITDRSIEYGNYEIAPVMQSAAVWDGGNVPLAPEHVTVQSTDRVGVIRVGWDWSWSEADIAILSWSDDPTAWESTSEPSTFEITNIHAAKWNIADLDTGITWYIRVKLAKTSGDNRTESPWSDMVSIDLSSAPSVPSLALSDRVITETGSVTASWAYSTTDGTYQAYAEITTVEINSSGVYYGKYAPTEDTTVDNNKFYFSENDGVYTLMEPVGNENPEALGWYEIIDNIIAHTETAQHLTINAQDVGWVAGETYNLAVRVISASGRMSDSWSDPVGVTVAEPLTATIAATSLVTETYIDTPDMSRDINVLKAMPLTATVIGAGDGGTTTLAIERAETYHVDRPDETQFNGYEGETIALVSQTGESEITIDLDTLIGSLDDGATYRLVATVQDTLGQSAEATLDFEVHWTHQAIIPEATATIDGLIAKITPVAPAGADETDVCDIYRLSADKPQLIVSGGTFGTTYVDPYPTIGEFGGHRVVTRTANGDYITEDQHPAWTDLGTSDGDLFEANSCLIDFNGEILECEFNMAISNSFEKDFQETKYLGGAIQGDWNASIRRTSTVDAAFAIQYDPEVVRKLRALAAFPGICHVRTKDGSSYAADVQVGDDIGYDSAGKKVEAQLSITQVDPEGYDGMSLEDWEEGTE